MKASERQVGGSHYKDMPIQPLEFIIKNGLNWCEGSAIKYICRHANKNGVQDIDKAIHYLELLKELEYDRQRDNPTATGASEESDVHPDRGGDRKGGVVDGLRSFCGLFPGDHR